MRRFLIPLLATALAAAAYGQRLDPANYVYPVLDVSRLYAANFGELRPAHFHAGIDIKTDGVEGKPLVAVADGYVSRVSLAAGGYGRAIYLTLDNGTTAVYGHLQRFRDDIEKRVREERYRNRSNGADLRFDAAEWPVRQGDTIGFSGNSGSSMGPHLHFELRDTPTQRLRNVVREGVIRPEDDLPPRIMRLHYIEVDTLDGIPVHRRPVSYAVVREAEGRYRLTREEPVGTGRKGYFVAEVTDRRNGVHNTFGVWRVSLAVDGEPRFEYRMDGFTHDLSRCCDAVSCYPMQLGSRNEAIRLARMERSPACFYPVAEERGIVRTAPGEVRRVHIEAEDDCGNRSALEFDIRGRADTFRAKADPAATALRPERTSTLRIGRTAHVTIPAGALYEPLFVRPEIRTAPEAPEGVVVLSPAYRFLDCCGWPRPRRSAPTSRGRCNCARCWRSATATDGSRPPAGDATTASCAPRPARRATSSSWRTRCRPVSGPSSNGAPTFRGPKGCGSAPGTTSRASRPGRSKSTDSGFPATGSRSRERSCTSSTRRPPAAATRCA